MMNDLYDLQLFAGEANTQTTGHGGLSAEMKTYYGMELLENAKPQLVHNQFAATKPLPTGGGKTVEWRKFGSFEKALTPLTEGVTPDGSGISVSYITKELAQYGDYTTVSDLLDLTAIDDVVLEITDRHGSNMGMTLDTVTRNEIQQGSQVIYAPKLGADGGQTAVLHRYDLTEGCKLTSELVAKAATQLKKMNAPTFEGKYVCILHPSVAFDLRQDPAWVAAHQYAAATELFSGEIGELHGVRFVETTEAKIFRGDDLAKNSRTLSVNGKVENAASVGFDGGTVAANALKGRYVLVGGKRCKVVDNFRLLATEKNINFSLQTTLPSVFLWIDSDKFEKIIFNLLSNAFKYTPDNKSITLIVMESGQFVSIAVKDEGIGISKDKVSSIFERFTTVSKENDMQPSSGIGLSLVNELVKMLHGEIQVESEVKKGSVFKLVLHKGKEIYAQDKNVEYILNDTSEEQETVLAEPEQNDKISFRKEDFVTITFMENLVLSFLFFRINHILFMIKSNALCTL